MRRRERQPSIGAAIALGACAWGGWWGGWVSEARAQAPPEEGPVVVGGPREEFRWLRLHRFGGSLGFEVRDRRDERRPADGPATTDKELLLRPRLELSTEAYLGHRNLVDLNVDVQLLLEDTDFASDGPGGGTSQRQTAFENLYDVSALILGQSRVPILVYSRRDQSLLDREFSPSLDSTTSETGAIIDVRSETAPTTVQYFHRQQDQSDPQGLLDYRLDQDTLAAQTNLKLSDRQHLSIDYTFDSIRETQSGAGGGGVGFSDAFDRHDLSLIDTLDFGRDGQHNLRSTLRYYSQVGDFAQERVRWDESLRLRHTDRFETRYDTSLEQQTNAGQQQRLASGTASLRHRLFESLVTTASVGGRALRVQDVFDSDDIFANAGLEYTKKAPYGRFQASVGGGLDRQTNSPRGGALTIFDESHTFADPQPILIPRRRVLEASIVVKDAGGVRVFVPGADYTAQTFADRTEIRRVLGGAIADGQTVLVTYEIGPEPGNTTDTAMVTLAGRYSIEQGMLRGLDVYVNYRQIEHALSSDEPSAFVLDDARILRYGAEYRIGRLAFTAEEENHDSTIAPFDATRLAARYDHRLGRASGLSLDLTREDIRYTDPDNRVELNRITGLWFTRLGASLDVNVRLIFRDEHDRLVGSTRGFEQSIELNWHKRQTEIFASFHNSVLDSNNESDQFQTIFVGFRRNF